MKFCLLYVSSIDICPTTFHIPPYDYGYAHNSIYIHIPYLMHAYYIHITLTHTYYTHNLISYVCYTHNPI